MDGDNFSGTNSVKPGFLVTGEELHRIRFEDGSWIDIRPYVTGLQRARWSKAATKYVTKVVGKGRKARTEAEMDFDNEAFLHAMLSDIVVNTSVGPVDVSQLREDAVTRIQREFERLNPETEEDDETLGESDAAS
jgi:hypothetical protein